MAGVTSISVTFSYTHPDEPCAPRGDIFIDFNGTVTRKGGVPASIVIRGGRSLSKHTKTRLDDRMYTLSQGQRVALNKILKSLSTFTDRATITSDNGALQEMCNAIYSNYCG